MNPAHLERTGRDEWLSRHDFPPVVEHRTGWLTRLFDLIQHGGKSDERVATD